MQQSTKSILWINYLKAVCIIAVYFVHSTNYYEYFIGSLNLYIKPFYVNGFFFVSGYLFFKKQLPNLLINSRCKEYISSDGKILLNNIFHRIVLPSTIFATIEFFPSYILRDKDISIGQFLYKTIGGCTYWFTSALVIAELLLFILLLSRNKNIIFYVIISSFIAIGGYWIIDNNFLLLSEYPLFPWCYKSGMLATIFLALGGLYWKIESYIDKYMNKFYLLSIIVLYISCISLFPKNIQVLISMHQLNFSGIIVSLMGIISIIYTLKWWIKGNNFLNYIGQNSIGFYFMSGALPIVISMLLNKIFLINSILGLLIVFVFSIIIAYLAVILINKYLQFLFDLRKLKSNV